MFVIFSVNTAFTVTSATKKLHEAVLCGDLEKVRRLLYPSCLNPLSCSVLYKTPDINSNSGSEHQDTPLHAALRFGYGRIATLLLEQDRIDANIKNCSGETPLDLAAASGYTDIVKQILQLPPNRRPDINAKKEGDREGHGTTALFLSIAHNHPETALLLLQQPTIDASALASPPYNVVSALYIAAATGSHQLVQAILRLPIERQPDIDARDSCGKTALDLALENQHFQAARLINEHTIYRKVQQLLSEQNCRIPRKILQRMLIIHSYRSPSPAEFEQIINVLCSQQNPALSESETNIFYLSTNEWKSIESVPGDAFGVLVRSVDAILRLHNPNYTLDDLPFYDPLTGHYLNVTKDEILRLAKHLMRGLPPLTESEIEALRDHSKPGRYWLSGLKAHIQVSMLTQAAIVNELQGYDIPQNELPILTITIKKRCNQYNVKAVVARAMETYYSVEAIVKEEIAKRSILYSRELSFQIFEALTDILTEQLQETIQQIVPLYCNQADPEFSYSQTNAVYCGKKNWLTQNGYNLLTAFAQRNHTRACNPATRQPILFKLPVKSIDALLCLENPTYDIDAVPLRDPSLHHEEFVVSKDELMRIAYHLCTHHKLAALTDEEIEHLRDETDPQMYTVRALVELLQQKIREQQPQVQEGSSADILSAKEAILMLQQDALLTMEQAARVLPLFGDQQRISLQKVKRFIAKRLDIIKQDPEDQNND